MKHFLNAIIIVCTLSNYLHSVTSTFVPRSQGGRTYIISQPVMHVQETHAPCNYYRNDPKKVFADFSVGFYYNQSMHNDKIAQCLLGSKTLTFSGSQVANRGKNDLLADNFGLAQNFQGSVTFCPRIQNYMVDFQYYLGLDDWCPGMFFRMELPVVHTNWQLSACQTNTHQSTTPFPALYMDQGATASIPTIKKALAGNSEFGDMITTWNFSKFNFCPQSITRVADLTLMLGKNFLQSDWYHCGLYFNLVGPVGNRPDPEFFFSPIVGNGKFWELGVGFTGHVNIKEWCSDTLALYAEATINHVMKNRQQRSFDFCNHGRLSRFMLLKELTIDANTGQYQYNGELINAINFATRNARIDATIKADATILMSYEHDDYLVWAVGYNFFGKTHENVCIECCSGPCDIIGKTYGIKGTEGVFYTDGVITTSLNSTQSQATIFKSAATDNPQIIPDGQTWTGAQAYTSNPPIIVSCSQLDPRSGAMPAQVTQTIFSHLTHIWNCITTKPYLTIGVEAEFSTHKRCCSLNQWGLWINGGLTF